MELPQLAQSSAVHHDAPDLSGLGNPPAAVNGMTGLVDDMHGWAQDAFNFQVTPQTFRWVAYGVGALFLWLALSGMGGGGGEYRGRR